MKKNKKMFIIIAIILFIVVANYFIEPAESEESIPEESEEMKKLQKEFNQLSIDYINLKEEKKELQKEINWLYEGNFETYKRIYESDFANEYAGETVEFIHKEFEEDKIITLVEREAGTYLSVWLRGQQFPFVLEFSTLKPENGFSYRYDFGMNGDLLFLGGIVTNDNLEQVRVTQDDVVNEANVIHIDEDLNVWYHILDYEVDQQTDNIDGVKIEATDRNGEILWEEDSFDGEWEG